MQSTGMKGEITTSKVTGKRSASDITEGSVDTGSTVNLITVVVYATSGDIELLIVEGLVWTGNITRTEKKIVKLVKSTLGEIRRKRVITVVIRKLYKLCKIIVKY